MHAFKIDCFNSQMTHRTPCISQIYPAVLGVDWRLKSQLFFPNTQILTSL